MTEFTSHEEYSYYSMVVSWIETNGYYLLISVILLTYLYRKGLEMYIHHEKRASLSEATQPDRVRLLNEKARQAREKQQAELERAAEEYKKKQEEKKEQLRKVQLGELIKKQGSGARSGYNPLNPNSGAASRYSTGTHGSYGSRRRPQRGG